MATYDAALDASGDLVFPGRLVTGIELLEQRLPARLGLHLGEWFADPSKGLPWIAWTQQRPPDTVGIAAALRVAIEGTPGVARVDGATAAFDPQTRAVTFTCTVRVGSADAALTVAFGSPRAGSVFPAVALRAIGGAGVLAR